MTTTTGSRADLTRYALLSIVASIVVIVMKVVAWRVSGSVGLLSDAAESTVNVVAAIGAFIALKVASRRPTPTTTSATPRPSTSPRCSRAS